MSETSPITLDFAADRLRSAERVLIIGHANPDGDALGSTYALAHICAALGKSVRVVTPDSPAERLGLFVYNGWAPLTEEDAEKFDLICSVDVASPVQLGRLSWLAAAEKIDFMLDHHGVGEPFAPCYIDPTASAAGEIVWRLYCIFRESGELPALPRVSRGIYGAILSDTGSFRYSNVTPETHRIAACLVEEINGADDGGLTTEKLCRELFGKRTLTDLKAEALAIAKLTLHCGGRVGVVMLTRGELKSAGLCDADVSGAVEVPRSLEGVEVALAMRQSADDRRRYKISSRSNTEFNVSEVCARFGGGGHPKAAGCTLEADSPEEALRLAVSAFTPV